MAFADPLKAMLATLGLTRDHLYGDKKNEPLEVLNWQTARHAMQTLGTQWGRDCMGDHLWGRIMYQRIERSEAHFIVIEDMRFQTEFNMLQDLMLFDIADVRCLAIERPGLAPIGTHPSETWDYHKAGVRVIVNDGTKEQLYAKLVDAVM